MASQWYYAHDEKKLGPFSQQQLKELAAAGTILPMDTVWQEGVAQGVSANRVKNLFPAAPADALPAVETPPVAAAPESAPPEKVVALEDQPKKQDRPARKGRAVAVKGADIVSQDGTHARYRKKCMECGHKDSACHMILITNKMIKMSFYCRKCRKSREVAIQCFLQ